MCIRLPYALSQYVGARLELTCSSSVDLDMARLPQALWGKGHEASTMHEILDFYNM